jgi:colanic acid biosynthesis glycosyl transferase WcaI
LSFLPVRILVIGINYAPEKTSVGPFTTGLCEHLAAQGHQVTVVTAFPYYPDWRVWNGYRGSLRRREIINKVLVHRVAHYIPYKPSRLVERLTYDFTFTISAFIAALFTGPSDVIYCSCPPPTVALAAYVLGKIKGAPYVIKLTDMASDAALATGILKEGLVMRMAQALEGFLYRKARTVICLCQGFIEKLTVRGTPAEKFRLIPDWGDTEQIRPIESNGAFRSENGFGSDQFLILHSGNMGKKQGLINVVNAAEYSREASDLAWVLVGQGEDLPALKLAIEERAPNVSLLPLQPVASMPQMYAAADVLLLNQIAAMEDAVIPCKLLTYMAAGRPIVAAVSGNSEAARVIRHANCGVIVEAEDPEALSAAVRSLKDDPKLRSQLGANARTYAEEHFNKAGVLEAYDEFFLRVLCTTEISLNTQQFPENLGRSQDLDSLRF